MSEIIAVTGATGYVGRFVVNHLLEQGEYIRGLTRPSSNRGGFVGEIEWVNGSLSSHAALEALVRDATTVIHLAYDHIPGKYRGGEGNDLAQWLDSNLYGSLDLLQQASAAQVPKFIFLSSRAVFSHTLEGRQLDETHPTSPDTYYGAYKAAVEAFLYSIAHQTGMHTVSIRATGVYGITYPIQRSKWWSLVQNVLDYHPITTKRGGTEVHGQDIARVIWAWIENPPPKADIIHLSDLYLTTQEIVQKIRQYTGIPGDIPDAPNSPPQNLLVCNRITEMGINLGGTALLEKTLQDLVHQTKKERR